MFIAVQVMLAVVGLFIMIRGRFDIGDRPVTNPIASLVGIVLTAQLPIALLIDISMGLAEGSTAGADGAPAADANWWIHPLVTCLSVLLAGGLTGIALRTDADADDVYASLDPAEAGPVRRDGRPS
ncbi:MAG TPA: hypothetical protein VGF55_17180 [Gemmataceae bacterium]|jgi:hypothetical protein